MRRPLIAGNWKMHMPNPEAVALARQLRARLRGLSHCDVLVCPPLTALTAVAEILTDTEIALGAQNLHDRRSGAFTGEVSGEMIRSTGASWVLIGHNRVPRPPARMTAYRCEVSLFTPRAPSLSHDPGPW